MDDFYKYFFSFITGSGFVVLFNYIKGRLQTMECHLIDDDILSKIPTSGDNGCTHENIYCKTFKLVNTTNMDISKFKLIFQFEPSSLILESYNRSKSGTNDLKMRKGKQPNECYVIIEQYNRTDTIEFVFKIANIKENIYYITESDCMGFKIKCKDKRKSKNKTKSKRSDHILTNVTPASNLE